MTMILSRANLEIAALASSDKTRSHLHSVWLSPFGTCATNGFALAVCTLPTNAPPTGEPLQPCTISADDARAIRVAMPRASQMEVDTAASNAGDALIVRSATDRASHVLQAEKLLPDSFPPFQDAFPTSAPVATQTFNIEYMERIITTARRMGARAITLDMFKGPATPMRMHATLPATQQEAMFLLASLCR